MSARIAYVEENPDGSVNTVETLWPGVPDGAAALAFEEAAWAEVRGNIEASGRRHVRLVRTSPLPMGAEVARLMVDGTGKLAVRDLRPAGPGPVSLDTLLRGLKGV